MVNSENASWDAFVSHASEDKEQFVRPLVEALGRLGASLWYDDVSLRLGDSLSRSIDRGIAKSRLGIIVISHAFLDKRWPEAELSAILTRKISGQLRVLPIWLDVDAAVVAEFSPILADLVALRTANRTASDIAISLLAEIRPDIYETTGRAQLEKRATGKAFEELEEELADLRERVNDLLCPTCEAPLVERIYAYDDSDPSQQDVDIFECGYAKADRYPKACPFDPQFPALEDYEISNFEGQGFWLCTAKPRSASARLHWLDSTYGLTEQEALRRMKENYNKGAPEFRRVHVED